MVPTFPCRSTRLLPLCCVLIPPPPPPPSPLPSVVEMLRQGKGGHVLNRSEVNFEGGALFYGGYAETGGALGLEAGTLT